MITLADGTVIDPVTKRVVGGTKVSRSEVIEEDDIPPAIIAPTPRSNKKIEDFRADAKTLNVIMAVIAYTVSGLSDNDICYALGCTSFQLESIRSNESYKIAYEALVDSFYYGQTETAKSILGKASVDAANTLASMSKKRTKEGLAAANSVLDRNEIGKANNTALSGLIIRVVTDDAKHSEVEVSFNG